jgi:DNA-binding MarR family transcriptional regulator
MQQHHRARAKERGSIVWLLAFLGMAARRRTDTLLTTLGLSPPEAMLLRSVASTADATVLGLADGCGLGGSTAVGAIDRLEQTGLVQRERDREDRRVVRVRITERGREVTEQLPALACALEDELTEGFSAAERETLRGNLTRLAETLGARSPELLEKLRAERLQQWERETTSTARGRGRRSK